MPIQKRWCPSDCKFLPVATLKFQQEDALKTVLPYGLLKIDALRTLTTESTAVIMPFKTQEILDKVVFITV
jgi:hypothetical protein